jgi:hypothetical protein
VRKHKPSSEPPNGKDGSDMPYSKSLTRVSLKFLESTNFSFVYVKIIN